MLESLADNVTTAIVAQRLSTIRNADQMVHLQKGEAVARGTFVDEVCARVPALQRQAQLIGLQWV